MILTTVSSENQPKVSNHTEQCTLLIVDDDPRIRRMLLRLLSRRFDTVLIAGSPAEAEQMLEHNVVTHLLSDYDLGSDCLRGTELVPFWRGKYPSIERAVILTGSSLPMADVPPEVDCVLTKTDSIGTITNALFNG